MHIGRQFRVFLIRKQSIENAAADVIFSPSCQCPGCSVKSVDAETQKLCVRAVVNLLINMTEADTFRDQDLFQACTVHKGVCVDAAQCLRQIRFFQIPAARKCPDPDLIDPFPDHKLPDQVLFFLPGRSRVPAAGKIRNLAQTRDFEQPVPVQTPGQSLLTAQDPAACS